jgi:hypothetical protein
MSPSWSVRQSTRQRVNFGRIPWTMVEEMESLYKNETWDLVKLHSGRNIVGSKWVFKKNMNSARQVDKFKA